MNEVSRETVTIKFDGPDYDDHTISIEDLIPTLFALAELIKMVNTEANGVKVPIRSSVRIPQDQNSVEFEIVINHTLLQHLAILFSVDAYKSASDIVKYVFYATRASDSLLQLIKNLAHKDSKEIEVEIEKEVALITWPDGTTKKTSRYAANVATSKGGAKQLRKLVQNIGDRDVIQFLNSGEILESFDKGDSQAIQKYDPDAIKRTITIRSPKSVVRIRKPDLLSKTQWEVVYQQSRMYVRMEDEEWLTSFLAAKVVLPAGSSLRVDLRHEIPLDMDGNKLMNEQKNYIEKVHEVLPFGDEQSKILE